MLLLIVDRRFILFGMQIFEKMMNMRIRIVIQLSFLITALLNVYLTIFIYYFLRVTTNGFTFECRCCWWLRNWVWLTMSFASIWACVLFICVFMYGLFLFITMNRLLHEWMNRNVAHASSYQNNIKLSFEGDEQLTDYPKLSWECSDIWGDPSNESLPVRWNRR